MKTSKGIIPFVMENHKNIEPCENRALYDFLNKLCLENEKIKMKFITIAKEVEAIQYNGKNHDKVKKFVEQYSSSELLDETHASAPDRRSWTYLIGKMEITVEVRVGDWIIIEKRGAHAVRKTNEEFMSMYMKPIEKDTTR